MFKTFGYLRTLETLRMLEYLECIKVPKHIRVLSVSTGEDLNHLILVERRYVLDVQNF